MQAYDRWLRGTHSYLFIVNNDVLVPSGVLTKLMHAMREDGAAPASGTSGRQRRHSVSIALEGPPCRVLGRFHDTGVHQQLRPMHAARHLMLT